MLELNVLPLLTSFTSPNGLGRKEVLMDQNSNYITLEMSIRLQMKDYRFVLGLKKTWIIAIVIGTIQIIAWLTKGHS